MSVQTFNPSDLSQSVANWAVAQRIVGPFAPHAQVAPNLTLALDPGYLLSGTTLTEVNAQNVGPFSPPASGFRIDRVVVDRFTGTASIVAGTANSLTPPAIPSGKLPVARVMLQPTTSAITNEIVVDERALVDLTPQPAASAVRLHRNGSAQSIPANTLTKVQLTTAEIDAGGGFDAANQRFLPSRAGYYAVVGQVSLPISVGAAASAWIYKNGSQYSYSQAVSSTTGYTVPQVVDVVYLNGSTDYIELYCWHGSGAAVNLDGNRVVTYLSATVGG